MRIRNWEYTYRSTVFFSSINKLLGNSYYKIFQYKLSEQPKKKIKLNNPLSDNNVEQQNHGLIPVENPT